VTITVSEPNQAISGALSRAGALSARISVSVCDLSGHPIAHQRMDGAAVDSSRG
jgi:uncharacterized protein GlcG (DUF336 family)